MTATTRAQKPFKGRRVLIRLGLILSPFLVLELVLRLSGYTPAENRFFHDLSGHRPIFFRTGDSWTVAPDQAEFYHAHPFPARKPPGRIRIVSVGDSITWGHAGNEHATPLEAYSEVLETLLNAGAEARRYEVINCGARTFGSARVLGVVLEMLEHEPDLVIAYFGTSEFLEEDARRCWLRHRKINSGWIGAWRTGQLLRQQIEGVARSRMGLSVVELRERDALLRAPFLADEAVLKDESARAEVFARTQAHISEMVAACTARKVPLVLMTVTSNLRWPPFAGLRLEEPDQKRLEEGVRESGSLLEQHQASAALELLEPLLQTHPDVSALAYLEAEALEPLGDPERAAEAYKKARDYDACPLRASSSFNDLLRKIAEQEASVFLVDIERLFLTMAPDGIPDDRLFIDHCHPKAAYHRRFAEEIVRVLNREELLGYLGDSQ